MTQGRRRRQRAALPGADAGSSPLSASTSPAHTLRSLAGGVCLRSGVNRDEMMSPKSDQR